MTAKENVKLAFFMMFLGMKEVFSMENAQEKIEKMSEENELHIVSRVCSASSAATTESAPYMSPSDHERVFTGFARAQRCGLLREILAEHVIGTESFLYSIDPGRTNLRDAATEVKVSGIVNAAMTCSAWLGMGAAVLDWEKQRFFDEKRLILDPYIHALVTGAHLEALPRKAIFDAQRHAAPKKWQDPPRFCRLPFKEGDVAIIDVNAFVTACEALALEYIDCPVFATLAAEAQALKNYITNHEHRRKCIVRCRLSVLQCLALPARQENKDDAWSPARGPGGRVLIEVGTFSIEEHVFEHCSNNDYAAASTEELAACTGLLSNISTRFEIASEEEEEEEEEKENVTSIENNNNNTNSQTSSLVGFTPPLPLLEPGVVLAVIPALYRPPRLDWHPDLTLRPGSAFCAIRGRKHILLGHAHELREGAANQVPPPTDSRDFAARFAQRFFDRDSSTEQPRPPQAGPRQILFVRDMLDGTTATYEAASWGMSLWHQGALEVFDQPILSPLAPGESNHAPSALAHLVLDCSILGRGPDLGTQERFAMPRCAICGKQEGGEPAGDIVVTTICANGCTISGCAIRHLNMARQDHSRSCPRATATPGTTTSSASLANDIYDNDI